MAAVLLVIGSDGGGGGGGGGGSGVRGKCLANDDEKKERGQWVQ